LGLDPVKTRALLPAPEFSWDGLRVGEYCAGIEDYLRESSPLVHGLRSLHALAVMELGLLESPLVRLGPEPWLFYRPATVIEDFAALQRLSERRLALFSALKLELRNRSVELIVLVVPDKSRVYADLCYGPVGMPDRKGSLYELILGELGQVGVPVVDPLSSFREQRRREPESLLYYPRDTHWTPLAMRLAAADVAEGLASAGIPLRREGAGSVQAQVERLERSPDLVDLLGLDPSWWADSHQLQEGLHWKDESVEADPVGGLALAGGSFSERGFAAALAEAAGEPVDERGVVAGRGPLAGLRETLYLIRQERLRPRILVWEFVERAYLESQFWLRGPAELGLR
jgi:alginate O-acetyltransferase complex protein AlgJ